MPETLDFIVGPAGEAHLADVRPRSTAETACLATWILRIPNQSPLSDMFMLSVIHLRRIPGEAEPVVFYEGAEHEIAIYALDPGRPPRIDDQATWVGILPGLAQIQFAGVTDDDARSVARLAAKAVTRGVLPIDPCLVRGGGDLWHLIVQSGIAHFTDPDHPCHRKER